MCLRHPHKKIVAFITICCALLLIAEISPVHAAERPRVLTIALFASGIGLKFASVFLENSAQDSYDQYLSTAIQDDIAQHRDDYTSKHDLSVAMSRTGIGLVGLAMLISVFDELNLISRSSSAQSARLRLNPGYNPRTREMTLMFQRQF